MKKKANGSEIDTSRHSPDIVSAELSPVPPLESLVNLNDQGAQWIAKSKVIKNYFKKDDKGDEEDEEDEEIFKSSIISSELKQANSKTIVNAGQDHQRDSSFIEQFSKFLFKGTEKLSLTALTPSALINEIDELITEQKFTQVKYLLYKQNKDSIMFITRPCTDADRSSAVFSRAGKKDITEIIKMVKDSEQYKDSKKNNKKIEIFTPLAMTHPILGFIPRAHWAFVQITEEQNQPTLIKITDSLSLSLGYDHQGTYTKAKEALLEDDEYQLTDSILTETNYLGDQDPLRDHSSCGHYVRKYIGKHALEHYPNVAMEQSVLVPETGKFVQEVAKDRRAVKKGRGSLS